MFTKLCFAFASVCMAIGAYLAGDQVGDWAWSISAFLWAGCALVEHIARRRRELTHRVEKAGGKVLFISITGVVYVEGRLDIPTQRGIEDDFDVVIVEKRYQQVER